MSYVERNFEDVLENNYSPEITDEEIADILEIMFQLKSRLDWNVEEDDSLFDKDRGPAIITELMTHFNNWKSLNIRSNNIADFNDCQLSVIYKITKLCFCYWIRDSGIVSEIIMQVHNCDGNFSSIFSLILNQDERIALWAVADQKTRQKEYLIMVFFLTHAHRAKLEFSGVRFVEIMFPSVLTSAISGRPEILLLLLHHGAFEEESFADRQFDNSRIPFFLKYLISNLWASFGTETDESSNEMIFMDSTLTEKLLCVRLILRVIWQIPIGLLDFTLIRYEPNGLEVIGNCHNFIRSIAERRFVPTLMNRYFEPSGLMHLCRLAIRNALNMNWNLPFGVFGLPLPKVLQRYVNLSED